MCTSDIEKNKTANKKTAKLYFYVAIFCLVFGGVYEIFGNGIYSLFMLCSFVFPLIGGTLPFLLLSRLSFQNPSSYSARCIYHSGIATLTVGSIVKGILDIYGTTNELIRYYWFVGATLSAVGVIIFVFQLIYRKK